MFLLLMPIAGSKRVYRHTSVALPEGWMFVGVAVALCVAGALLDAVGT